MSLTGTPNDDRLTLGLGERADLIDGGAGIDTLVIGYSFSQRGLFIDAQSEPGYDFIIGSAGRESGQFADDLSQVSSIEFLEFDDVTFELFVSDPVTRDVDASGAAQSSVLVGNGFANTMTGSAFDDLIFVGVNNDVITTGAGADDIIYKSQFLLDLDGDTITDFTTMDRIILEGFTILTSEVTFERFSDTAIRVTILANFDDRPFDIRFTLQSDGEFLSLPSFRNSNGTTEVTLPGYGNLGATFGDNVISGTLRNDIVVGLEGDDILDGGVGDDRLNGGSGFDIMTGGTGNDIFSIEQYAHTGLGAVADRITDFSAGDRLILDNVFYSADAPADEFIFIGEAAFSGIEGQVRYLKTNGQTTVQIDGDGDGTADHEVILENGEFDLVQVNSTERALGIAEQRGTESIYSDQYFGTAGADTVNTLSGNDAVDTRGGDDVVNMGAGDDIYTDDQGSDTIDGGEGTDTYFKFFLDRVDLVITDTSVTDQLTGEVDTLTSIERMSILGQSSSVGSDVLDASARTMAVALFAGQGDDILIGGSAGDTIEGDRGADTMTGGFGNDSFNLDYVDEIDGDVITDFELGDSLRLLFQFFENVTYTFLGGAEFNGQAGVFRSTFDNGHTVLEFDRDGDRVADGVLTITSGEFAFSVPFPGFFQLSVSNQPSPDGNGLNNIYGRNFAETLTGSDFDDKIQALFGDDTVSAGDGDDLIYGGDGDDTLRGDAGADLLNGGAGADSLDGGAGFDTVSYAWDDAGVRINLDSVSRGGLDATSAIDGTGAVDTLRFIEFAEGSDFDDLIFGSDRRNTLTGGEGDDELRARGGDDTLIGGTGNNELNGQAGFDTADYGWSGAAVTVDLLAGTAVSDGLFSDTLIGIEQIVGSAFADSFSGDNGNNRVNAGEGDDTLSGLGGNDLLFGEAGEDELNGQDGSDRLYGGDGDDMLFGGADGDILDGGAGSDLIEGGAGGDRIFARDGNDTINGGDGFDIINGQAGDDIINGGGDRDILRGQEGDDTFTGGAGDDRILGGDGDGDTAVYTGNKDDYLIIVRPNGIISIEDLRASNEDGRDVITDVEFFQFADGTFDVAGL